MKSGERGLLRELDTLSDESWYKGISRHKVTHRSLLDRKHMACEMDVGLSVPQPVPHYTLTKKHGSLISPGSAEESLIDEAVLMDVEEGLGIRRQLAFVI